MRKLWYASFVRGHDEKNNQLQKHPSRQVVVGLVALIVTGGGLGQIYASQNDTPQAVESVSPSSREDLLSLPAFDLDIASDQVKQQGFQVGDELGLEILKLEIPGIQNPARELKLDTSSVEAKVEEQNWTVEQKESQGKVIIVAVPLKPGKMIIPSMVLRDLSGKAVARTNPFSIQVDSAIKSTDPKPQQPAEPEPPVELAFPWWIIISLGVLALALIGGLGYWVYRWKKNRSPKIEKKPEIVLPEDQAALERLNALEKEALLEKGKFKAHYFKVSEIIKFYVGARYRIDALESTAQEILQALDANKTASHSVLKQLESLFFRLDRVKFTDYVPENEEARGIIPEVREMILITRRVPVSSVQTGVDLNASR